MKGPQIMEKSRALAAICLIIGWLHLVVFSLLITATFISAIYGIYYIFESNLRIFELFYLKLISISCCLYVDNIQIQNIVLVLVAGFAATTIFGIFIHGSHEFIKGLTKVGRNFIFEFLCLAHALKVNVF